MADRSARHRASGPARTPLDDTVARAAHRIGSAGRRTALVAGTSGLVVSVLSGAAAAELPAPGSASTVDTHALTATARAALATAAPVAVPAEATWTFQAPELTVVADPPPAPAPAVESTAPESAAADSTTTAAIPASAVGSAVVEIAARYIGSPYVYGGATPDGFDCSGFTMYVYAQLGIELPRSSAAQRSAGTVVPAEEAQPGDLMWWDGHVAIYAGGNLQIDSSQPGTTVQFREIHRADPTFIRLG